MLDVNKIHFVLASTPDKRLLVEEIFRQVDEHRSRYQLLPSDAYWERHGKPDRYDTAEVVFFKRMLQHELPLEFRQAIIHRLF